MVTTRPQFWNDSYDFKSWADGCFHSLSGHSQPLHFAFESTEKGVQVRYKGTVGAAWIMSSPRMIKLPQGVPTAHPRDPQVLQDFSKSFPTLAKHCDLTGEEQEEWTAWMTEEIARPVEECPLLQLTKWKDRDNDGSDTTSLQKIAQQVNKKLPVMKVHRKRKN